MAISVGMDEYMCLGKARYSITDLKEEYYILLQQAKHYRDNRLRYEAGSVDPRQEISAVDVRLFTSIAPCFCNSNLMKIT